MADGISPIVVELLDVGFGISDGVSELVCCVPPVIELALDLVVLVVVLLFCPSIMQISAIRDTPP